VLSRDSQLGQRIVISLGVKSSNGIMNGYVESGCIGEGLVGEVVAFKIAPDRLDVIEFGRIFWQPFNNEPMGAGSERSLRRLAHMDGTVIEHHDNREKLGIPVLDYRESSA
jgi:hypothetical protein